MKHKLIKTEIYNYLTKKVIDTAYFERLSGWKQTKHLMVTKRHSLFEYATDDNGYTCNDEKFNTTQKWYYLEYIEYKGYRIPLSCCSNMFNPFYYSYDLNGNIFNPLLFEFSEDCEYYRVYEQKGADHTC